MRKLFVTAAALIGVMVAGAQGRVEKFEFSKFNLHVYTSAEAMGDVSLLVEGKKKLVVLEPQSFYKSQEDFNNYAKKLNKPIEKVVANYHAGGLAGCDIEKVVMVEPMVEFMKSEMAQGMMKKFAGAFKGQMDTRSVEIKHTIPVVGKQKWNGVQYNFVKGAESDFPASSVNIGGEVYYTHFAPSKAHLAPMRVRNVKSLDAIAKDVMAAKNSGCEVFVGSHGKVATMKEVDFMVEYLQTMKSLRAKCKNGSAFAKALKKAYPKLSGEKNIEALATNLYK